MKKAEVKSKNRYLIAVNLFLIAILMVVAVYAWFSSNAVNRVDTYDVQVQSDNTLELSFDKSNWSTSLNLADLKSADSTTSVLDAMKFIAVTGNGDENFYIPALDQKQNYASVNTTSDGWKKAVANQDYLKFTVNMRSKDPIKVYLSSDSYAKPSSSKVTGADCGNPSSYATGENSFSKDCVIGALRVAGYDDKNTKKFVWITNPEYHLNNDVGSADYSMDIDTTGKSYPDGTGSEGQPFQWNNPFVHRYYKYNGSSGSLETESNVITKLNETVLQAPKEDTTLVATLNGSREADGYFHSQAEFVVWIEGCDTEARRALIDGKFNLSLIFDSFSAEEYNVNATTPEDVMNGVGDEFD